MRVINFKSFKKLEVELGGFNVLIGANASGKSNFVQIFKFLRDIYDFGLENAVSMQGGAEYLRNINIGASENLSIKVVFNNESESVIPGKKELIYIKIFETTYEFALKFTKEEPGFKIAKDNLIQKCKFVKPEDIRKKTEEKEALGEGKIITSSTNGKVKITLRLKGAPITKNDIHPLFLRERKLSPNTLLLKRPFFLLIPFPFGEVFDGISVYDFDPKLPKKATPITGKAELEEDGSNLSIILKNIMQNKEKKRKFLNLVKDLLPFVSTIGVEKFADKSLLFELQETYFKKQYLPASLISDGTINITALIVALYFERKWLTIFEEPGRNIHPYLISRVIEMMKDAPKRKQIIITTHNPEIVKHAGLDNILFISRDKEGFSTVTKPADKEEVGTFLKNNIGIEELYIQNLLGD